LNKNGGQSSVGYQNGLIDLPRSFRLAEWYWDEVRVYNRALSADEILELYRLGTRKFQPTQ